MNNLLRKALLFLLAAYPASAGLSLVLTPGTQSTALVDPARPKDQAWRIEFQLHDWVLPSINTLLARVYSLSGTGSFASILKDGAIRIFNTRDGGQCDLPLSGSSVLIRVQRDPVAMRFSCEVWSHDGSGYRLATDKIVALRDSPAPGGSLGGDYTQTALGFLRVFDSLLPDGSRPPTTASVGNLLNFRFDGDTRDSSGKNQHVSFPGAAYVTTSNQVPAALPKTDGSPAWSNWTSLRAGFPATLDATASYSLADASDTVTYRWQQLAGPSTVRWSDRTAAKPVIRGLIFGTYKFRLQVTDASSKTSATDLELGAVATDSKGVVVQANPAADVLFGPMIAFGKNPWPWADQMTLHSAEVRKPYLDSISPPSWATDLPGTISYVPSILPQPAETTVAVAVSGSDTIITVANASKLDFSSLPAVVMLHPPAQFYPIEDVRICGVSGNNLTVCYDGRAWRAGTYLRVTSPAAWPSGTTVSQSKTKGTGTEFLAAFCPAGPGEEGQIIDNAGSVRATPGSVTLTGVSTSWSAARKNARIRIAGTHSGQNFAFFATVSSVESGTSITMSRPWPATADAGTFSYSMIRPGRYVARGWTRPDGSTGKQSTEVASCESDTALFTSDLQVAVTGAQTNQKVTWNSDTWVSDFAPNFYDEVLAHYAGYLRSGYSLFRENARKVGDYLPTSPTLDEGYVQNFPRRVGATGIAAAALIDGRTDNWRTLRQLARNAIGEPYNGAIKPDCNQDLRETAYELSWLALAALFDPVDTGNPAEPNQRSYWKAQLAHAYNRDQSCKGAAGNFPSPLFYGGGSYTMTNGSTAVTGANIPASTCNSTAFGTLNVTSGSNASTGSGFISGAKIAITGTRDGQPYLFLSRFTVTSPSSITLESPYDGDSGTYSYQVESDEWFLAFGKNETDRANINTMYACRWVDSTRLTLDRPWAGASGTYAAYRNNLVGYGQQPFILGIKVFAMKLAAMTDTGQLAFNYGELAKGAANWILSTGYDPVTGGLHYGRGYGGCEPLLHPRMGCTFGTAPFDKEQSRMLNAEAQNALRVVYEANPTKEVRDFGDQFYGSQWGKLGGPYFDSIYLKAIEPDTIWTYKWLGFLFGMGMAHQWPAVRIGGVLPPDPVTSSVSFNLGSIPGATAAKVKVTAPSGAEQTFACNSSPCSLTVDARQGAHWYRILYLNAAGATISSSDPDLIELN